MDQSPQRDAVSATLRVALAVVTGLGVLAVALRVSPGFAEGRTGAAILGGWRGGFFAGPVAAIALASLALAAVARLRRAAAAGRGPDAARRGQATMLPLGAAVILAALYRWPSGAAAGPDAGIMGGVLLACAFPALIAERVFAAAPGETAAALRALLLLPVLALSLCGLALVGVALGPAWPAAGAWVARAGVGLVAAEIGARAAGRWFLPPPAVPRPAIGSVVAALLAGVFGGAGLGGAVRAQTGLDFSRSFALRYLRDAALPGALGLAMTGFALSGLKQVGIAERAVYERFGAPVRVMGPGLHAILPWPMGRLRRTEAGIVHSLPLGAGPVTAAAAAAAGAEDAAGPELDRLWSGTHPNEAVFLIGNPGGGFQVISADLRLLWRVGPADADATRAVYAASDPAALVAAVSRRVLTAAFAMQDLDAVLRSPEALRLAARDAIAGDAEVRGAGIEVVDLIVEAVHPPAEASVAYHAVQAAEIASRTEIAVAERRARGTANATGGEARTRLDNAAGHAAEILGAARGDTARFAGERAGSAEGPAPFAFERRVTATVQAAGTGRLTLLDRGLPAAATVDLRPEGLVAPTVQNGD